MFSFPRNLRTEHDRNQPRVPAGNPDGGQWTISGGSGDLDEFSAAKRRRPGSWQGPERWDPRTWWSPVMRALFDSLRKRERLDDLLGDKRGVVVAWTEINGKEIFGVNARSREYTSTDNSAARRLRAALIEKYPETIDIVDIGRYPNAAVFHAEVTTLLRAAVQNGAGGPNAHGVRRCKNMCKLSAGFAEDRLGAWKSNGDVCPSGRKTKDDERR